MASDHIRVTVRFPASHYIGTLPPGTRAYVVRQLVDQAIEINRQQEQIEAINRKLDLILSKIQGALPEEQKLLIDPDDFLNF